MDFNGKKWFIIVVNVGITIINHPWLGMVNIPTIYGDFVIWWMVYSCYTHIITFVARLAMVQVGSITCKSWFTMGSW